MANPNNAVGTNAAYAGRTSVNAFNDGLAAYSRGVISGWACAPSSGLTVTLGGDGTTRDVAVAEDNAGNKTSVNNISGSPVEVTISAAPGANSRIDAIVAYVDNPPQGTSTIADNYEACGLISVQGTAAANPVAPNDSAIRSAITADGASGTTAYYVVLAYITIASGTTDITSNMIKNGDPASIRTALVTSRIRLYSDTSGTSGSIALSDNVANYTKITIEFSRSSSSRWSATIFNANGRTTTLSASRKTASGVITFYTAGLSISDSTITIGTGGAVAVNSSGIAGFSDSNELYITGVWGEK